MTFLPQKDRIISSVESFPSFWVFCFAACLFGVPFLGLSPLKIGLWSQSEGVIIALFGMAGIAGISFFFRSAPLSLSVSDVLFLSLIFLSAVLSLFHERPALSWFGPIETGGGIFMIMAFWVFIHFFQAVIKNHRRFMMYLAALSGVLIVGFDGVSDNPLYSFPSYQAFIALMFLSIALLTNVHTEKIIFFLLFGVSAYLSQNMTVILGAVIGGTICFCGRFLSLIHRRLFFIMAVIFAPVALIAFEYCVANDHFLRTLWGRSLLHQITLVAVQDNPMTVLTGAGWGKFADQLLSYYPVITGIPENWDSVARIDFHSHHFLLEALSGAGILGAIIVMAFYVSFLVLVPAAQLNAFFVIIFSYITLYSNWFETPSTIPLTAFSFGVLMSYLPLAKAPYKSYIMGGVGALLIYAGFTNLKIAYAYNSNPGSIIARGLDVVFAECNNCSNDQNRGGVYLAVEAKGILARFDKDRTPDNADRFVKVMMEIADYEKPSVELMTTHLDGLLVLLTDPVFRAYPFYEVWKKDQAQLRDKIRARLPYRRDLGAVDQ